MYKKISLSTIFQSTSPVWRTTPSQSPFCTPRTISIHVPPCGGRPKPFLTFSHFDLFQSTSPVWRTTYFFVQFRHNGGYFNPRPPCGGRPSQTSSVRLTAYFNPRPPCGGRLFGWASSISGKRFQSTSPVWRTTRILITNGIIPLDFNPRPPCGGRRSRSAADTTPTRFQSTSPVWRTTEQRALRRILQYISIHVPRVEDDRSL